MDPQSIVVLSGPLQPLRKLQSQLGERGIAAQIVRPPDAKASG